jgi:hypothetical protein
MEMGMGLGLGLGLGLGMEVEVEREKVPRSGRKRNGGAQTEGLCKLAILRLFCLRKIGSI